MKSLWGEPKESQWAFVNKQLNAVDASASMHEAAVKLLKLFGEVTEQYELDANDQRAVLTYVQKLALGHALESEQEDEKWGPVIPGEYNIGDTVRVRADAYVGDHGLRHNGKRGRIVAVHQAKTVVLYDDAPNSEESFYHEPYNLERLL